MTLAAWIASDGTAVPLDGSTGVGVLRGAAGLDGPPVENTIDRRVGADGGVFLQRRRPPRPIRLPLFVNLNLISAAEVVRLFQGPGTLIGPTGRELREIVHESGLEGIWSIDTGGVVGLNHRKFPVDLVALDPWWYGGQIHEPVTLTAPTAWNAAIPWNSAIPWDGGASVGIAVEGDVAAWPQWSIHGAIDTLTISVIGVGAWTWDSPLDTNSWGTVDHRPGSRSPRLGSLLNGVAESSFGLWGLVDDVGSLDWGLGPGTVSVVVGSTGDDANTEITVTYEPRYLTSE